MPFRMIKDTIRTSRNVSGLTDFEFRVWVLLITYVDDYGRGSADPELLKGVLFPRCKGEKAEQLEEQIGEAITALARKGMVTLYDFDDEPYLYFPKWGEHQRIRTKVSKYPDPPAVSSDSPHSAAERGESQQNAARNLNLNLQKKPKPKPEPNARAREDELARVMSFYMDKINSMPSPMSTERLISYTETLGADLVLHALEIALDERKTSWSYIQAILARYTREEIRSVEEAIQSEQAFQKSKGGKTDNIFLQMYQEEFE